MKVKTTMFIDAECVKRARCEDMLAFTDTLTECIVAKFKTEPEIVSLELPEAASSCCGFETRR